jgi:hypothetical protein
LAQTIVDGLYPLQNANCKIQNEKWGTQIFAEKTINLQGAREPPGNPPSSPFSKGEIFSSLYQRAAGRDFWDG